MTQMSRSGFNSVPILISIFSVVGYSKAQEYWSCLSVALYNITCTKENNVMNKLLTEIWKYYFLHDSQLTMPLSYGSGLLQYSNTCIKPKILLATGLYKNSMFIWCNELEPISYLPCWIGGFIKKNYCMLWNWGTSCK